MARILLGVTGSVAALRAPLLATAFRSAGHDLRLVATEPARYFFRLEDFDDPSVVYFDAHEWPGSLYRRGDPVLHIEFRDWADLLVIAPLDANTLGKFALGLADNFLTCVFRAWDFQKPVVLAPAMNTLMWESPVTRRHLRQLLEDRGDGRHGSDWTLADVDQVYARHCPGIVLIPPIRKRLACGDLGIGAMAEVPTIAAVVHRWAEEAPPLFDPVLPRD